MATALNLGNANGKTITLRNPDTNLADVTVEMDKVVVKDVNGNVVLPSGSKIQGDFSNATSSLRTAFQTSTVNGNTIVGFIPNGTSTTAVIRASNSSDISNANAIDLAATSTSMRIQTAGFGTAAQLPLEFWINGTERMRIDTTGNVGIGTTAQGAKLQVVGSTTVGGYNNVSAIFGAGVTSELYVGSFTGNTPYIGSGGSNPVLLCTNGTEKARVTATGDLLLTSGTGGLGYGTGAGIIINQGSTSGKATPVAANKTTGQITMNNAALAAGAYVEFGFTNSIITTNDLVVFAARDPFIGYRIECRNVGNGGCTVRVTNITGGSLSEAVSFNFAIIKGTNS